jgi:E1A/CREB-binding protein
MVHLLMLFTLLLCNSITICTLAGPLSNGYQQSPANFSLSSGGNMSSMGAQTITSQMIPTPGFNSNSNNNNNNNQSYMNLESANNGGGFSTVETTVVSQPPQQKQHLGGQNSHILHNLGSQMGSGGIRSGLQQKAYGFPNGGLGLIGNNLQIVNESGTSEGFLTGAPYASSPKPLQQHIDQHQRPLMQGNLSLSLASSIGVLHCVKMYMYLFLHNSAFSHKQTNNR